MDRIALVTGADRGLGRALVGSLLASGWKVFAGRHLEWPELDELASQFATQLQIIPLDVGSDKSVSDAVQLVEASISQIDLLICNAGIQRSAHVNSVREELNFDDMLGEFNVNAVGALRVVHAFLPLLDSSDLKRLCFVSSEAGSIGASTRTGWFGYCMSKAALNMAVKNLSNDLVDQGYSFRLYHPGWMRTYMSGTKNTEAPLEPEQAAEVALQHFLDDSKSKPLTLHDWEGNDLPW